MSFDTCCALTGLWCTAPAHGCLVSSCSEVRRPCCLCAHTVRVDWPPDALWKPFPSFLFRLGSLQCCCSAMATGDLGAGCPAWAAARLPEPSWVLQDVLGEGSWASGTHRVPLCLGTRLGAPSLGSQVRTGVLGLLRKTKTIRSSLSRVSMASIRRGHRRSCLGREGWHGGKMKSCSLVCLCSL